MYHFGWFSSGRDPAARQLLSSAYDSIKSGDLDAEIDFVFLNRVPGESAESDAFINLVSSFGLPLICYSYERYRKSREPFTSGKFPQWRLNYDKEIMSRLKEYKPDVCLLAGYMLIVGPDMCRHFDMINLHPAAPGGPTGTWRDVILKLISSRAAESGVMMHLVTPELDRGPVVTYCTYSLNSRALTPYWQSLKKTDECTPLFMAIRQEGLKREFPLVIATMKVLSNGKVNIVDKTVRDNSGKTLPGFDLTAEINKYLGI